MTVTVSRQCQTTDWGKFFFFSLVEFFSDACQAVTVSRQCHTTHWGKLFFSPPKQGLTFLGCPPNNAPPPSAPPRPLWNITATTCCYSRSSQNSEGEDYYSVYLPHKDWGSGEWSLMVAVVTGQSQCHRTPLSHRLAQHRLTKYEGAGGIK